MCRKGQECISDLQELAQRILRFWQTDVLILSLFSPPCRMIATYIPFELVEYRKIKYVCKYILVCGKKGDSGIKFKGG